MILLVDKDDLLRFIRMQQREINIKINKSKFIGMHKRFKYYKIIKRIEKFMEDDSYTKRFITMPGLRGVGKSTILFQIYSYLIENEVERDNILYLDVDELLSNYNTSIKEIFDVYLEYFHNTIPVSLNKKIFLIETGLVLLKYCLINQPTFS